MNQRQVVPDWLTLRAWRQRQRRLFKAAPKPASDADGLEVQPYAHAIRFLRREFRARAMIRLFSNITWLLLRSSWQNRSAAVRREFVRKGYKPYAAQPELRPRLVDLFIEGLSDSDEGVRRGAVSALSELADPRAIVPLIERLPTAKDYELRDIANALGEFDDPRAIAPLAMALRCAYGDSKEVIESTLSRLVKPGLGAAAVASVLTDGSDYEKARTPWAKDAETMSRLVRWPPRFSTTEHRNYGFITPGLQRQIEEASRRITEAFDWGIQHDLGKWLEQQNTPEEWRRKDPQVEFEEELGRILGHVKGELEALEDGHTHVLIFLIRLLRGAGDPVAIDTFTQLLRHSNSRVRARAISALGKMPGPDTPAHLMAFLTSAESTERKNAVEALGKVRHRDAAPQLIALLQHDPSAPVRGEAVEVLGMFGCRDAAPQLIELLRHDPSGDVRCKAVELLGKFDCRDAEPHLLELLKRDPSGDLRSKAAELLGEFGCRDAVPQLIELLRHDPSWDVRGKAAEALGLIGDPRAVEALIEVLAAPDSLSHNPKDEPFPQFSSKEMPVWHSAVRALVHIEHPSKSQALLRVLANSEARPSQRIGAAEVLGKLGDRSAIPALLAALNDKDGNVRLQALSVIRWYGALDDLSPVIALLGDPLFAVRYKAASILESFPHPLSLRPLLDCYREMTVSWTIFSELKRGLLLERLADGMNKIVAEASAGLAPDDLRDVLRLQDASVPVSEWAAESYTEGWRELSFEETRQHARAELIRRLLPL